MPRGIINRTLLIFVVLGAVLAAPELAASDPAQGSSVELGVVTQEIVGGGPASQGENRWMSSLQRGGHFCGASLVADRWVATAAHCVIGEKAAGLKVWVGGNDLRRPGQGVTAKVKKILIHPNYNDSTLRHDIALIELKEPVAGGIAPVVPASGEITSQHAEPGRVATVSGWGALSESGASPEVLHRVELPIVSNGECNSAAAYGGDVFSTNICAGLRQGGKDACYGDSGGPLWVHAQGTDYLVGIVSWGEGCAEPRKYGVYTRIASYTGWIQSTISGAGSGGGPGGGGSGGTSGRSCEGNCGDNAGRCWCDPECSALGDCCRDFEQVCGSGQDSCANAVCDLDAYCCNVEWDLQCDDLAAEICN